jgi:putative oxidoreductase
MDRILQMVQLQSLERHQALAPLFIRAIVGWHLMYGTADNIVSWERMLEFRDFLEHHGFPFPLLSAHLSVYAQFVCGLCFVLGLFVRPAGAVMIFNFVVALGMVHIGMPYPQNFPALMMLCAACYFLLAGAGRYSLDARLNGRRRAVGSAEVRKAEAMGRLSSVGR